MVIGLSLTFYLTNRCECTHDVIKEEEEEEEEDGEEEEEPFPSSE